MTGMQFKELGRSGVKVPVLGMGTWGIGGYGAPVVGDEEAATRALRFGLDLGMRFIDTAESYANGHSEEIVRQVGIHTDLEAVLWGCVVAFLTTISSKKYGTNRWLVVKF